jgi:peptidoglycan/LPS O-acetylase OafA/YrhL
MSLAVLASIVTAVVAWHLFENPVHRWAVRRIDMWADNRTKTQE